MRQYFCQCSVSPLLVNDLKLIPPPTKKTFQRPYTIFFDCFSLLFAKDLKLDFTPPPQQKKASYAPVYVIV